MRGNALFASAQIPNLPIPVGSGCQASAIVAKCDGTMIFTGNGFQRQQLLTRMSIPYIGSAIEILSGNSGSVSVVGNKVDSRGISVEAEGQFSARHIPYPGCRIGIRDCQLRAGWVVNQASSDDGGICRTVPKRSKLAAGTDIPDSGASVPARGDETGAILTKSNA